MSCSMKRFVFFVLVFLVGIGCSSTTGSTNNAAVANTTGNVQNTNTGPAKPLPSPSNKFTAADIAQLKWIEGTWRGMDGDKPFYERYKLEGTTLIVDSLREDGSVDGELGKPFELKDGEFGKTEGPLRS